MVSDTWDICRDTLKPLRKWLHTDAYEAGRKGHWEKLRNEFMGNVWNRCRIEFAIEWLAVHVSVAYAERFEQRVRRYAEVLAMDDPPSGNQFWDMADLECFVSRMTVVLDAKAPTEAVDAAAITEAEKGLPFEKPPCPKCGGEPNVSSTREKLRYLKCEECGHSWKMAR